MKYSRVIVAAIILAAMVLFSSFGGKKKMASEKNEVKAAESVATAVSEMQKLMAEKAFKMPGENNPIMAHKYGADPAVLE